MARVCKNCGEKLFPADTFCGFCGEVVDDTSVAMENFSFTPRSLVGSEALTRKEREEIERAKQRFITENAGNVMPVNKDEKVSSPGESSETGISPEDTEETKDAEMPVREISTEKMMAKKRQFQDSLRRKKEQEEAKKIEGFEEKAEEIQSEEPEVREPEIEETMKEPEIPVYEEEPDEDTEASMYDEEPDEDTEASMYDEEETEENWDTGYEEEPTPQRVTSAIKKSYDSSWEEAEKRAIAEQMESDRIQRRKRINEKPRHKTRDIILLSIGIVILIVLLVWLIGGEMGFEGDKDNKKATSATGEKSSAASVEIKTPSDYGKPWDGSVATKFTEGKGTEDNPYKIKSGSELAYLAAEVNRGVNFEGEYFSLEADLDLGGLEWTPIGYYYNDEQKGDMVYSFNGSFAGNNHKIYNYKIATLEVVSQLPNFSINKVCGLFGTTYGASIADLKIENCTLELDETGEGEILAGALVGCAYDTILSGIEIVAQVDVSTGQKAAAGLVAGAVNNGSFANVFADGTVMCTTVSGINDTGLIAGYVKGTEFTEISATGKITATTAGNLYCGGMAGYAAETKADNCSVNAEINASTTSEASKLMAGGLIGFSLTGEDTLVKAEGKLSAAAAGTAYVGGVYGYAEGKASSIVTANMSSATTVAASTAQGIAGGVYGSVRDCTLSGATLSGSVSCISATTNYAGGIAGQGSASEICDVVSDVNVTASATGSENALVMCGGAAGNINMVNISTTTVKGSVSASSQIDAHTGGVAGYINGGTFTGVTALGKISNSAVVGVSCGGFAGYACGEYTLTHCTGSSERVCDGETVYEDDIIAIIDEGEEE